MDLGLDGKIALVCASTSGLGEATASALSGEGAKVIITGHNQTRLDAAIERIPGSIGIHSDFSEPGAARQLHEMTTMKVGQPDVIILNGPGPRLSDASTIDRDQICTAMESIINFQVELVNLSLPNMKKNGWGRIIAISSSGTVEPIQGLALSNMLRAGLSNYLKTLATEVAPCGITSNVIIPGRFETERTEAVNQGRARKSGTSVESIRRASINSIPAERYGRPSELAALVCFLAGAQASYITGSMLRCDGGLIRSS